MWQQDTVPTEQADSSLPSPLALPEVEQKDDEDKLLLGGDLVVNDEFVRGKDLDSVKCSTVQTCMHMTWKRPDGTC